jgi:hypothetical protein
MVMRPLSLLRCCTVKCTQKLLSAAKFVLQECKALGVFSQLQALEYLGGKLTQRGNRAFERRRKSKVRLQLVSQSLVVSKSMVKEAWLKPYISSSAEGTV